MDMITVNRQALYQALQIIIQVVPKGKQLSSLPDYFRFVFLSANNGVLTLKALNEHGNLFVHKIEAQGEIEVGLNYQTLLALIKPERFQFFLRIASNNLGTLPSHTKCRNGSLAIICKNTTDATIEVDGFVLRTQFLKEDEEKFEIPKDRLGVVAKNWSGVEFKKSLEYVLSAVSNDPTRPAINQIKMTGKSMVATDGNRLHIATFSGPIKLESLCIPGNVAALCFTAIDDGDKIFIKHKNDKAIIGSGRWEIHFKTSADNFPDYNQVIPRSSATELEVDRRTFFKALKILKRLSDDVVFSIKDYVLLIAQSLEHGDVESKLSVNLIKKSSNKLVIGFRISYLLDAINSSDDMVRLSFSGEFDPVVIDSGSCKSVLMPRRIK